MARPGLQLTKTSNVVLFCAAFAVWEVLDRITKSYFESSLVMGQSTGGIPGIFTCTLVHNTGGAWGMMSTATMVLAIFSLVVCLALTYFALFANEGGTKLETLCLALVVAGGFGNCVDRFAFGYVIDFINPTFIDFPVFNVADIGVTCGMIVFFVALLVRTFMEAKLKVPEDVTVGAHAKEEAPVDDAAEVVAVIVNDVIQPAADSSGADS